MSRKKYYTRESVREQYHEKRNYCLEKLGGKCVRCGTTERLEFDHIEPSTKEKPVTQIFNRSFDKLDIELAKCQLLCENCHTIKTAEDFATGRIKRAYKERILKHGTPSCYNNDGCRCDDCRKAHTEYWRTRRKLIKAIAF